MPNLKHNLTDQTFGRLRVLSYAKHGCWLCQCQCGTEKIIAAQSLITQKTTSCGCYNVEATGLRRRTHGLTESDEYKVWCGIKRRCLNPADKTYQRYGATGITICERWKNSFENFLADMGERPSPEYTIERMDNALGYEPANCRWATRTEQARNRKSNRLVSFQGVTKPVQEWANALGIGSATLLGRLNSNWTTEQALTTPVIHGRNRPPK